jgi:ABC-type multidrug transport system fused ATPase/permease subunit
VVSDVSASYAPDQEPVLHHLNLVISACQKIGVCGPSGSGKTSFVAVLHMLEISGGSIEIDGVNISNIPRRILRDRLTIIPQDPIFLKGTIKDNLDPRSIGNRAVIKDVLKKVGLWTTVRNAGGMDMPMEPEELLSHGQR